MSERPPVPGCDDYHRLANADHRQGGAEGVARLDPRPVAEGQVREVTLRLRSGSVPPAMALTTRHRVLLSLLDPAVGAARLRLTYLLRHDAPLEVEVLIGLSSEHAGATEPARKTITKRSLEALSRVVFPGMAAVNPSMSLCEGPTRRLRAPAVDVMRTTAARNPPMGPVRITSTNEYALYLPNAGAASMAIDSTLIGMAEAGIESDIMIDVRNSALETNELRALADTRERLVASIYKDDPSGTARALLAEVEAWLQARTPVLRVEASLRLRAEPLSAEVNLAEGLLFGGVADGASTRSAGLDLSSLVRPGAAMPNFVVHPMAEIAISEAKRRRTPRPPRGDVVRLGADELDREVAVSVEDLRQHLYIVGQTGVGKSTMLKAIALSDAAAGRPFIMVDPHGDLHTEVLDALPRSVRSRAVVADAADFDSPFSLNILEVTGPYAAIQRNFIANQMIGLFKSVYGHNPDAFGPMFEAYFRGALFLLMDAGGQDASLLDLERVFGDGPYRRGLLEKCTDPSVTSFWRNIAQKAGGEASLENIAPYITSKLSQLAGNPLLRPILCSSRTTLDIPRALSEGRSVLVNLAKGLTGSDAGILGGIVTIRLFAAGMERARLPVAERRPTRVILDEFQTYGTVSILAEALAEVRKYGLSIVLANQSIAQVDGRAGDIAHAILGNTGNLAVFRVGPKDAALLAEWLGPDVSPASLLRLPNHTSIARLLRAGAPSLPVQFQTGVRV